MYMFTDPLCSDFVVLVVDRPDEVDNVGIVVPRVGTGHRPIRFSLGSTTVGLINLSVTVVMLWSILLMSIGLMKPHNREGNKASE
ncbi:hypothetical protein AX774_g1028 [Zancudomyces culisetae]|uniref:Uncharacterized protein n=2 Tax=Zancudomyces culisetae TaxID=1213189 RepID=A0A1R1PWR7_ZANCU|nr:hypothetical protein AX774_g1028 [Zancudomyces culisetae]|eukprot:OMH85426.1 hypothetical protein AX774_g1028 [Zancudomyces culisetae]